jgi:crotonobetainyl-CoA:carnitine CoA-transferase CaiB-like acyl-CoA transferase
MSRLGLGWDMLHGANPRVVLASITGFGQTGPRRRFKSCDLVAAAFGGHMFVSGSPSTPPLRIAGDQSFYLASLHAAVGIVLALRRVARGGDGVRIDMSAQEAVVSSLEHVLVRRVFDNVVASRQGSRYWNGSFAILPCADGHILAAPLQQWDTVLQWVAGEGMAEDLEGDEWRDESYRREHVDHVLEVLSRWTRGRRVRELFELAQLMRLPWAPVQALPDVLHDDQLRARGFFVDVASRGGGSIRVPGMPYRFASGTGRAAAPAPSAGEHTAETFRRLGLSDAELRRLAALNVI